MMLSKKQLNGLRDYLFEQGISERKLSEMVGVSRAEIIRYMVPLPVERSLHIIVCDTLKLNYKTLEHLE